MTLSQSPLTEEGKKRRRDTAIGYRFAFCQCISGIAELFLALVTVTLDSCSHEEQWLWIPAKTLKTELWLVCFHTFGACWQAQTNSHHFDHLKKKLWVHCMDFNFSIMIHISEVMKNSRLQDPELGSSRAVSSVGAKRWLLRCVWLGQFSRSSLPCGRKSFAFLMEVRTLVFYSNMVCHLMCRIETLDRN